MAPVDVALGPGVRAAFTTVADGNLSTVVGDVVPTARDALARHVGAPVVWLRQVHGVAVHRAGPDDVLDLDGAPGGAREPVVADAAVTTSSALALAVLVADCVPVLLADVRAGVVGVAHAGRLGTLDGVVDAVLDAMAGHGADPATTRAALGPAACGRCYEVPAALRDEAEAALPGVASTTSWGTPALDLPGAVERQLRRRGVPEVVPSSGCTIEDDRWFSHRGAGRDAARPTGRLAGVVRLLP